MDVTALNNHIMKLELFLKTAKIDVENKLRVKFQPKGSFQDWIFLRVIGTGTFGSVVLGRHIGNGKLYALKLLDKEKIIKYSQVPHTMSEIRLLDAVNFQFIVKMEYFFTDNVYLYIVMPYEFHEEIFMHLQKVKKFDEGTCKFIAVQVIFVFEYLHYMGIIYRDLKPENILFTADGYIKIADFGFAKKIDNGRTYTLCGTPQYLAPELILSQSYNRSVDWWTLGILIYEMAAGYPPFSGINAVQTYKKIIAGKFTFPVYFSRDIKDLLTHLIEIDRTKRYGILKDGSKDVKMHIWFKNIDFEAIFHKNIQAPYIPSSSHMEETGDSEVVFKFRKNFFNEYQSIFAKISISNYKSKIS